MSSLVFDHVGDFWITESTDYIPSKSPPRLKTNVQTRSSRLQDITAIKNDFFYMHYGNSFHDCSVRAVEDAVGTAQLQDYLKTIRIVSDRKSLRKLMANYCLNLDASSYYIKKEPFELVAEKINGTVYLGGKTRYEESRGGYGESFERFMTASSGSSAAATYRLVRVSFPGADDMSLLVRHEVDAIDSSSQSVELKCRKEPNPRYGLGSDYFLNIWVQMALSNTPTLQLGIHRNGALTSLKAYTLSEVQGQAGLSTRTITQAYAKLKTVLSNIMENVPEGKQVIIDCPSANSYGFKIDRGGLTLVSPELRARLTTPLVVVPAAIAAPPLSANENEEGKDVAGEDVAAAVTAEAINEEAILSTVFTQAMSLHGATPKTEGQKTAEDEV